MEKSNLQILTNGIIKENPVLVLVLGTCPTMAVTTMAKNGIGMGLAATFVLLGSNIVISLLKKVIPDKVRIPCYIVVIAGFVTLLSALLQAYATDIYNALGIFLPLIVVNCIILGRAEMFASKNSVLIASAPFSGLQGHGHQNNSGKNQTHDGGDPRKTKQHHVSSPFRPGFKTTPTVSAASAPSTIRAATTFLMTFITFLRTVPTVLCVLVQLE